MAVSTEIDGYTLNADGQWTVDGVIQTQGAETGAVTGYNADGISNNAIDLIHSTRAEANAKPHIATLKTAPRMLIGTQ